MSKVLTEGGIGTILPDQKPVEIQRGTRYCIPVSLGEQEGGMIQIWCPILPGVASQGRSEREARLAIREALIGVILEYKASGMQIPWQDDPGLESPSEIRKWVWIDAR